MKLINAGLVVTALIMGHPALADRFTVPRNGKEACERLLPPAVRSALRGELIDVRLVSRGVSCTLADRARAAVAVVTLQWTEPRHPTAPARDGEWQDVDDLGSGGIAGTIALPGAATMVQVFDDPGEVVTVLAAGAWRGAARGIARGVLATTSVTAVKLAAPPVADPVKDTIVMTVRTDGVLVVAGKEMKLDALDALGKAAMARSPSIQFVLRYAEDVPYRHIDAAMTRLKAAGVTRLALAPSAATP